MRWVCIPRCPVTWTMEERIPPMAPMDVKTTLPKFSTPRFGTWTEAQEGPCSRCGSRAPFAPVPVLCAVGFSLKEALGRFFLELPSTIHAVARVPAPPCYRLSGPGPLPSAAEQAAPDRYTAHQGLGGRGPSEHRTEGGRGEPEAAAGCARGGRHGLCHCKCILCQPGRAIGAVVVQVNMCAERQPHGPVFHACCVWLYRGWLLAVRLPGWHGGRHRVGSSPSGG